MRLRRRMMTVGMVALALLCLGLAVRSNVHVLSTSAACKSPQQGDAGPRHRKGRREGQRDRESGRQMDGEGVKKRKKGDTDAERYGDGRKRAAAVPVARVRASVHDEECDRFEPPLLLLFLLLSVFASLFFCVCILPFPFWPLSLLPLCCSR